VAQAGQSGSSSPAGNSAGPVGLSRIMGSTAMIPAVVEVRA
jgi:hypothetical protein